MASCSQYSAAFGYQVYIVPVSACGVDLSTVTGGVKAGGFIDPTVLRDQTEKIIEGATAAEILAGDPGENVVFDASTVLDEATYRLFGLTNSALETDTSSETVTTYDTESKGFDQNIATSKSWSISLEGVSQFTDAGYKVLRLCEQNAVAGSLKVKIGRVGPTGTTESVYGFATLTNFSESIEAGSIVSWSVTAEGYGGYAIDLDNGVGSTPDPGPNPDPTGPINAFTLTDGGSELADGTFADQALTGGSGNSSTATFTVSGGVAIVDSLTPGFAYKVGDTLSPALGAGPATGGGAVLTVSSTGGSGLDTADSTPFNGVSATSEVTTGGSGATFDITIEGGEVTAVVVDNGGGLYEVGDELTFDVTDIGSTSGTALTITVDSVSAPTPANAQQPVITVDSLLS